MSRLPSRLQPLWPYFKRVHRLLSFCLGLVNRRIAPLLGRRGVPRRATTASLLTQELEPDSTTYFPAGPPEQRTSPMPRGEPVGHHRFAADLEVEIPARYAVVLENGVAVGDYGANITQHGTLDYETSGYFGLSSWREHPIFLRARLPRPQRVHGRVLNLNTRGCSSNYYHFMFDALPRFGIFQEAMPGTHVDAVIVPHQARYQRELLELAGVPQPWLQPGHGNAWTADELIVPSTPNQELGAPEWGTRWLLDQLRPSGPSTLEPYLYISRGDKPNTRRFNEEAELWPHLEERGFSMIDPGSLSVQEQINTFHAAKIVVAPHGAGLTNMVFCTPGTKVLELFAPDYVHTGLWTIAQSLGHIDYSYLVGSGSPARADTGVLSDVAIPWKDVLSRVDEMLTEDRSG